MIHVVNCNGRDCPWFRRWRCSHPAMSKESAALGIWDRKSGAPITCPLRKNVDILVPAPLPGDDATDIEKVVKDGSVQLCTWLELSRTSK